MRSQTWRSSPGVKRACAHGNGGDGIPLAEIKGDRHGQRQHVGEQRPALRKTRKRLGGATHRARRENRHHTKVTLRVYCSVRVEIDAVVEPCDTRDERLVGTHQRVAEQPASSTRAPPTAGRPAAGTPRPSPSISLRARSRRAREGATLVTGSARRLRRCLRTPLRQDQPSVRNPRRVQVGYHRHGHRAGDTGDDAAGRDDDGHLLPRPERRLLGAVGLNVRIQAREGAKDLDVAIIPRTELEAVLLGDLQGDFEDVDRVQAQAFSIERCVGIDVGGGPPRGSMH